MGQTNVIAGVLLLLFFVYITTKGELPKYLAVVGFGSTATAAATTTGTTIGTALGASI